MVPAPPNPGAEYENMLESNYGTMCEMPRYQCHKQVHAFKIKEIVYDRPALEGIPRGGAVITPEEDGYGSLRVDENYVMKHRPQVGGYYVVYDDSYKSFSPSEAFESGYAPIPRGITFGQALEALKAGRRVARKGWNSKGMFLFLLPAGTVPKSAIHDLALREVIDHEVSGDTFDALGSVRMFTTDKKVLTGWLASQTDMLSEDWVILH